MSKGPYEKSRHQPVSKVAEAALTYWAQAPDGEGMSTISSKNQITLPAHLLREMGLSPGDRLAISREGTRLVLRARPKDWVRYHAGSLAGLYGAGAKEADAYVRELREEGDRSDEIEKAWSAPGASAPE